MWGPRHLFVFLMPALLAACGWAEWPAPERASASVAAVSQPEAGGQRALSSPAFVTAGAVVVGKGDTVYALSRRHGVSVRAIIEANRLAPPYHLNVGQRIALPRERGHTVRRGDTLYSVARAYDVDVYGLARANRIKAPYTLYVGQRLRIPGSVQGGSVRTASVAAPKAAPRLSRSRPKAPAGVPTPPAASGKGFMWPIRGRLISGYGAKSKGLRNDGINIAAPRGTAVKAADNGVVAYAGNELRGFGNLLLVKHANGWVTAYAHNDTLMVKRGQKVAKGQVIAKVGSTGRVRTPQLHFELRKGKRTVDPKRYLRV